MNRVTRCKLCELYNEKVESTHQFAVTAENPFTGEAMRYHIRLCGKHTDMITVLLNDGKAQEAIDIMNEIRPPWIKEGG